MTLPPLTAGKPSVVLRVGYAIVKIASLSVGGLLTLLCLASVVGLVLSNIWAQVAISLVVALLVPLFIADRLLPSGDEVTKARGLPSEVIAITWLLVPLVFLSLGGRPILRAHLPLLEASGFAFVTPLAAGLAGSEEVALADEPVRTAPPDTEGAEDTEDAEATTELPGEAPEANTASTEPVAPPSDEELSPAELFRRWAPSVVSIQLHMGVDRGGGTGFFISGSEVVTNHHVIAPALEAGARLRLGVKLMDGRWARDVFIIDSDADRDLARLRVIVDAPPSPVVLGDIERVTVGERAISIGNPLGLEHTLTDGIISARRVYENKRFLQTSTPLSPGNSGGPLFDAHGRVLGVSTAQVGGFLERAQNLNLAVPVDDVRTFIARTPEGEPQRVGGGEPSNQAGSW